MSLPPLPWLLLLLLLQTHLTSSQSFTYTGFNSRHSTNLSLTGIAKITTSGILKLTNISSHQIGRGFYPDPIRFKNKNTQSTLSFSTSFAFSMVPRYHKLGGHGIAFTISPFKDFPGAQPSQFLGILNVTLNGNMSNHIFFVEFDTVQDFEFLDINNNHVGVNINRMRSVNSTKAGFFVDGNSTKHDLCLHSGKKIQAWIDYDGDMKQLNISLSLFSKKPNTPIMSIPLDLSSVFYEYMYVGFSAATGAITSDHYIYGWSFSMGGKAESFNLDKLPSLDPKIEKGDNSVVIRTILISVVFGIMLIGLFIGTFYVSKYKDKKTKVVEEEWELTLGPHPFSYKELKDATKGFHEQNLLGFGGSGEVYKGVLQDPNTQIAVKKISRKSRQGPQEFLSEVSTVGRVRHRNLVQLLGWSSSEGELLLVYDFMANGSLDKFVYSSNNSKLVLSWEQRFKIINDIANGLLYLHEGWEQAVVHRDVKAGNVLLDADLNGRLGDFGLAKLYDHDSSAVTTKVVGTLGYLAPELTRTGKPTLSSDVYAFGALLLEVVCGRRPVELKASPEELILVDWVWDKWREGCLLEVVDSRLKGVFNVAEVTMVLKLGLLCSSDEASIRPSMGHVIRYLKREVPLPEIVGSPRDVSLKGGFVVKIDGMPSSLGRMKSW